MTDCRLRPVPHRPGRSARYAPLPTWRSLPSPPLRPSACLALHPAANPAPTHTGAFPSPFPTIVGHEGAGIVVSVGSAVRRVAPGDSVLLSFSSCQACAHCEEQHPAACATWTEHNFGRFRNAAVGSAPVAAGLAGETIAASFFGQSAFARHAVVMESSCVKVPAETDLKMLAPLGCGLQTGSVGMSRLFGSGRWRWPWRHADAAWWWRSQCGSRAQPAQARGQFVLRRLRPRRCGNRGPLRSRLPRCQDHHRR